MATAVDTMTINSSTINSSTLTQRSARSNGHAQSAQIPVDSVNVEAIDVPEVSRRLRIKKNYRHVAAVHSRPQTTCLSHDAAAIPSFLGFRNLMVIVLGKLILLHGMLRRTYLTVGVVVVGNLRLMIENFNKVCQSPAID
jgi:diacylglycerol O-acyltransferase 1